MSDKRLQDSQDTSPTSSPEITPRDLYPTSDIRFVMVELGKIGTKVDRLIEDVGKQSTRIGTLETTVDRLWTGTKVAIGILTVVAGIAWWAMGDIVSKAVREGLRNAIVTPEPQSAPPPVPAPTAPQPPKR